MKILEFLEELATCAHYQKKTISIIAEQSDEVKNALQCNDSSFLKKQISNTIYYPNEVEVVKLISYASFI